MDPHRPANGGKAQLASRSFHFDWGVAANSMVSPWGLNDDRFMHGGERNRANLLFYVHAEPDPESA